MKRRQTSPSRSMPHLGAVRRIKSNTPPRRRRGSRTTMLVLAAVILLVPTYLLMMNDNDVESDSAGEAMIPQTHIEDVANTKESAGVSDSDSHNGLNTNTGAIADTNTEADKNADVDAGKNAEAQTDEIKSNSGAADSIESSNLIKPRIDSRYAKLPSPPWPQLDHRISKAIVEGDMIGFDPSQPLNDTYSNTIVTAYYEFTSKHSTSNYENWFQRILKASEPMIIFVEPQSKWFDFVKEKRTHAPTIVAQLPFEEGIMSTTFSKEFWDFMFSIDTEAKVHKASHVYKIWNEKHIYMYGATMLNPFNTPGFAWMDAGYFRQEVPQEGKPIIKVNITEDGIAEEKLVLLHVRNDPLDSPARVNIAGNSFLGTRRSFMEFYPKYYETFWDWISIKKFIGSDQFVMTETCRRYPSHCHPFFPGRFRTWFAMYKLMQGGYEKGGSKDYTIVSPQYLFLDEPPVTKPVPTGKRVGYCDGEIVTRAEDEAMC